ncbi:MAG: alpha/beta fold hydrolase [Chloroflexi bacterium]|nr:alpha/beta fold hydrolase [Chloroflexota bacterium]
MPPTPTATRTQTPTGTLTATPTRLPTSTPDPFAGFTVSDLTARAYGSGALQAVETLGITPAFTRTLVTYPSDGLTLYGFVNEPKGQGPFPVIIVVHGYVNPATYRTLTYTTRYADSLAEAGFLTIHPDLRGHGASDGGPNPFRIGYAVDVLNLIALVNAQAGQPGPLAQAAPGALGLWGHSMGGGITMRAITVSSAVRGAVLYGSMSGDERANLEQMVAWRGGERGLPELETPQSDLERISPIEHLERITAAVSIHHGDADPTVPPEWSADLCQRLQTLGKTAECFTYPGQPHILTGEADQQFITRTVEFFQRTINGGPTGSQGIARTEDGASPGPARPDRRSQE